MRVVSATVLSVALWACSATPDPPYQGSSGDPSGTGAVESGSSTSGDVQTGTGSSGASSQSSGSSTTGKASTGRASSGAMSSTGSSRAGASGEAVSGATSGTGSSGTSAGTTTGGSGDEIHDAGASHRDAAPVELTGCAAQVPTAVFGASCEASLCHNAKDHQYGLDLQSPGVAARLVNQPSFELPSLFLVDPNDWMQSWILIKVEDSMPPAGVQMPQMGAKLTPTQIGCLQQWVEAEAAGPY
jgi:hypothetical protein